MKRKRVADVRSFLAGAATTLVLFVGLSQWQMLHFVEQQALHRDRQNDIANGATDIANSATKDAKTAHPNKAAERARRAITLSSSSEDVVTFIVPTSGRKTLARTLQSLQAQTVSRWRATNH